MIYSISERGIHFIKKNVVFCVSSVFIVLFSCLNFSNLNYIAVLEDEFGYWGTATAMAGYNWSELMANTGFYAPGYSILLLPIVLFVPHALWYKAAICLNVLLLLGTYFISCKIGKLVFPDVDIRIVYIISALVAIYPGNITYLQVAWSETLQYFLIWLLTYLIVLLENKFSHLKMTCALLVAVYLYFVHNRNIGIWICLLFSLFLILIKHKKRIGLFCLVVLAVGLGYLAFKQIKTFEFAILYKQSANWTSNNFEISGSMISSYFERVVKYPITYLQSVYGKVFYLLLGTAFTFPIAIYYVAVEIIQSIKRREIYNRYLISKVWSILIVVCMLLLTALQMMFGEGRKDIIVYSRYFEHTIGPALFLGLSSIFVICKQKLRIVMLSTALLFLPGIIVLEEKIKNAEGYFNSICAPVFGAYYDNVDNVHKAFLWIFLAFNIIVIVVMMSSFVKSILYRQQIILLTFLIFFSVEGVKAETFMNHSRAVFESATEPVRDVLLDLNSSDIYYILNPEHDEFVVQPKYLQYMVPDCRIHLIQRNELTEYIGSNALILIYKEDMESQNLVATETSMAQLANTNRLLLYQCQ